MTRSSRWRTTSRSLRFKAITRGIDALGEVTVRVTAADGQVYTGRGSDNDIIVSSTKAYINALNRLISVQREKREAASA